MLSNKKLKKLLLPIGILIFAAIIAKLIIANPPEAKRKRPAKSSQITIEVITLKPQEYLIQLDSFGTVQPRTQSLLISQAAGQINYLSDNFRQGGFFTEGEILLKLDDRDHIADVKIAEANLLEAKQRLTEEQARAEQAKIDWQRIGNGNTANDLVLRKPQLAAAQAKLLSSQAQLAKAQLALERTKIVAPYNGRILSQKVDLGQVVNKNNQLAEIYAVDTVEVRLPIKNNELSLIDLPEDFQKADSKQSQSSVIFTSAIDQQSWQGNLVRTEGAINEMSQQLYVVAQIDDPYGLKLKQTKSIKIGQYVSAKISGKTIQNALVIPTKAIYQGSYVYIVENNVLLRKEIELLWKNSEEAIVKTGLSANDKLVTTALGQVSSGTPVSISGDKKSKNAQSSQGKQGQTKGFKKRFERMPEEAKKRLINEAKERGISLEELMKEKRKQRKNSGERP